MSNHTHVISKGFIFDVFFLGIRLFYVTFFMFNIKQYPQYIRILQGSIL